jgi:hypothetical protein
MWAGHQPYMAQRQYCLQVKSLTTSKKMQERVNYSNEIERAFSFYADVILIERHRFF